ncbi:MAG: restriction endonuclease subunit S [Eubacteriales bacterium]|nr:restriction endonuclease subunit S [Eubacteriales bacterium]
MRPDGWREVKIKDVCNVRRGSSPRPIQEFLSNTGMPWVKIADATADSTRYISKTKEFIKMEGVSKSVIVTDGTLIISNSGTAGLPKFMKITACVHDGWLVLTKLKDIIPNFLYYQIVFIRNILLHNANDSVMKNLTIDMINDFTISLPVLDEQKAIADTLSCLDDKIELNNRINKTLEEMAQAIFKSWFVDFEPFQDGEFENSELGRIPKGWRVGSLGEYVKSIDNRGKTPPLAENTTEYPIIDVKALSGLSRIINYDNCTKYVEKETYDNWFRSGHPQPLDILISTVGSLAEMKLFLGSRGCIAQNVVGFRCKNISPLYMYQYLQFIKQDLISYNIGSVQPSIKVTHIIKQKILIPDDDSLKSLDNILEGITEEIFLNFKENQTLAIIRDALLPKLMSGEIRVPIEEGTIDGK